MLDAMQLQAERHWPTLGSLDKTVDADVMLPQTVLSYGEYQSKIQRLALYAEQGDYEAMQDVLDNKGIMARKNLLLQPLFRDLKSQIRHMTYTPEFALLQEYVTARNKVIAAMAGQSATKREQVLDELKTNYADLLRL